MVPYVRKSFMKHYIIAYVKTLDDFYTLKLMEMSNEELDAWYDENKEKYLKELNLTAEEFYFNNRVNLDWKLSQSAIFDTKREIHQAVEGMYHNLKIWA